VHPNNPTGNYCKPQERERLNQICNERGLAVIADEVFLDFALDGVARKSFVTNGRAAGEPLTFTLSGISKICGLPQMKMAWVVVSGRDTVRAEAVARLEIIADTYLSVNAPLQLGLAALLATRSGFQEQVLRRLRVNLVAVGGAGLEGAALGPLVVEGGWQLILKSQNRRSDECQANALLEERGVRVHPGDFYGLSGSPSLVLSLLPIEAIYEKGLEALRDH